jgi:hypothetical protein
MSILTEPVRVTGTAQQPTVQFVGVPHEDPEPNLGGLALTEQGITGDPAVLMWLAGVRLSGRAW